MFFVLSSMGLGVLLVCGIIVRALTQEFRHDRIPALLYHRFLPGGRKDLGAEENPDQTYVCYEKEFNEQMKFLNENGYSSLSLNDYWDIREGRKVCPPKGVLITCDDGFESNYLYAYPILRKLKMKATIFMSPDRNCENFKKNSRFDKPLTDSQLLELDQNGVAIESHGLTHRYLTEMSESECSWELNESKRILENLLKRKVPFLAIPSGAYNRQVKKAVIQAGYLGVFSGLKGSNHGTTDPWDLRRVVINRDLTISGFEEILGTRKSIQLRLTSMIQNLLLRALGPKGLDEFRRWLLQTKIGAYLIPSQTKVVFGGLAVLAGITLMMTFWVIL